MRVTVRPGANLRAEALGRGGERLRQARPCRPARTWPGPAALRVAWPRLEDDAEARAGRPGPGEGPVDAAGRDDRAQQLGLEELGDEVGDRHRPPAQEAEGVAAGKRPELAADAEQVPHLRHRRVVDRGRRHRQEGLEDPADPAEALVEREVPLRVVRRDLARSRRPSARRRRRARTRGRRAPGAKTRTSVWMKERPCRSRPRSRAIEGRNGSGRVQDRGAAEPGRELLGDRDAADDFAPLEDDGLQTRPWPGSGRDQAVGPAADDDDVLHFSATPRPSRASSPRGASRRRSSRWRP